MTIYTVNIQKGGALLEDSRRMLEAWSPSESAEENLERITNGNLLGKATRRRSDDILMRILRPRLVASGAQVIPALRELLHQGRSLTEALYFESANDDALLAAFAEGPMHDWYESGRTGVSIEDVTNWLAGEAAGGRAPEWTPTVRTKVGRGLLAALRDFGVLEGAVRKTFATPRMTLPGFTYVAYRLHERGLSSRGLAESTVWKRWLLDAAHVDDLFAQASRAHVLTYGSVGSTVRIDWHVNQLEEAVRVAA
jgi:hypothetical protein